MSYLNSGLLSTYNSLTDKHLAGYFNNTRIRRHLQRVGLITRSGKIVPDKEYRLKLVRRDHQRHVRECLAQAIFHKVLDMERHHQIEIKRKLEDFARRERVHKIKVERSKRYDEDVIPLISPKPPSGPRNGRRQPSGPEGEHSESSESPGSSRPNTAPGKMQRPHRLQPINRNTASVRQTSPGSRLRDSSDDTEQQFTLTEKDLRPVTVTEFSHGLSPYQLPIINNYITPVPPSTKRTLKGTQNGTMRGRRLRPTTAPSATAIEQDSKLYKTSVHSNVSVTMVYYGKTVHLSHDDIDMRDEVKVFQQHCGGENVCVYKGRLMEGEAFLFVSRRHRGFPFSLTFFLNGLQVDRLSSCCEFKHRKGSRLGGKHGHFGFSSVGGASPCYKCIISMGLDKKPTPPKRTKEEMGKGCFLGNSQEMAEEAKVVDEEEIKQDSQSRLQSELGKEQVEDDSMETEAKDIDQDKAKDDYDEDFEADDERADEDMEEGKASAVAPDSSSEKRDSPINDKEDGEIFNHQMEDEEKYSDSELEEDDKAEDMKSPSCSFRSPSSRSREDSYSEADEENEAVKNEKVRSETEMGPLEEQPQVEGAERAFAPAAEKDQEGPEEHAEELDNRKDETSSPAPPQTKTTNGDPEAHEGHGDSPDTAGTEPLNNSMHLREGKEVGKSGAAVDSGDNAAGPDDCLGDTEPERAKSVQEKLVEAIMKEAHSGSEPELSDTSTEEEDLPPEIKTMEQKITGEQEEEAGVSPLQKPGTKEKKLEDTENRNEQRDTESKDDMNEMRKSESREAQALESVDCAQMQEVRNPEEHTTETKTPEAEETGSEVQDIRGTDSSNVAKEVDETMADIKKYEEATDDPENEIKEEMEDSEAQAEETEAQAEGTEAKAEETEAPVKETGAEETKAQEAETVAEETEAQEKETVAEETKAQEKETVAEEAEAQEEETGAEEAEAQEKETGAEEAEAQEKVPGAEEAEAQEKETVAEEAEAQEKETGAEEAEAQEKETGAEDTEAQEEETVAEEAEAQEKETGTEDTEAQEKETGAEEAKAQEKETGAEETEAQAEGTEAQEKETGTEETEAQAEGTELLEEVTDSKTEGTETHTEGTEALEKETGAEEAEAQEKETGAEDTEAQEKETGAEEAEAQEKETGAEDTEAQEKETGAEEAEAQEKETGAEDTEAQEKETVAEDTEAQEKETGAEDTEAQEKETGAEDTEAQAEETEAQAEETEAQEKETGTEETEAQAEGTELLEEVTDSKTEGTETHTEGTEALEKETGAEETERQTEMTEAQAEVTQSQAEVTQTQVEVTETQTEVTETQAEGTEVTETQAEGTEAQAEVRETQAEVTQTQAEGTEAQAEVTETQAEETETEVTETQAEVTETQAEGTEAQAEVRETQTEVTQTQAEVTEAQAEMTETQAEGTEAHTEVTETQAEVTQTQAEGTEAQAEVTETQAEETETEVTETQAEVTQTQAEVTETQAEGAEAQSEVTETQAEVIETQAEVTETQAEVAETQAEVTETQAEMTETQAEVAEVTETQTEVTEAEECEAHAEVTEEQSEDMDARVNNTGEGENSTTKTPDTTTKDDPDGQDKRQDKLETQKDRWSEKVEDELIEKNDKTPGKNAAVAKVVTENTVKAKEAEEENGQGEKGEDQGDMAEADRKEFTHDKTGGNEDNSVANNKVQKDDIERKQEETEKTEVTDKNCEMEATSKDTELKEKNETEHENKDEANREDKEIDVNEEEVEECLQTGKKSAVGEDKVEAASEEVMENLNKGDREPKSFETGSKVDVNEATAEDVDSKAEETVSVFEEVQSLTEEKGSESNSPQLDIKAFTGIKTMTAAEELGDKIGNSVTEEGDGEKGDDDHQDKVSEQTLPGERKLEERANEQQDASKQEESDVSVNEEKDTEITIQKLEDSVEEVKGDDRVKDKFENDTKEPGAPGMLALENTEIGSNIMAKEFTRVQKSIASNSDCNTDTNSVKSNVTERKKVESVAEMERSKDDGKEKEDSEGRFDGTEERTATSDAAGDKVVDISADRGDTNVGDDLQENEDEANEINQEIAAGEVAFGEVAQVDAALESKELQPEEKVMDLEHVPHMETGASEEEMTNVAEEDEVLGPETMMKEDEGDLVASWVNKHQASRCFQTFIEPLDDLKDFSSDEVRESETAHTKELSKSECTEKSSDTTEKQN
ncbi:glutamate-rich protein 3 isoform X2 [Anguilla rostrata]|uniref:glutamate-rich protein 3 isoform X2 n=1 Tax=Anguilla rostrata TaxID=7938 RepID=UPI0030CC2A16